MSAVPAIGRERKLRENERHFMTMILNSNKILTGSVPKFQYVTLNDSISDRISIDRRNNLIRSIVNSGRVTSEFIDNARLWLNDPTGFQDVYNETLEPVHQIKLGREFVASFQDLPTNVRNNYIQAIQDPYYADIGRMINSGVSQQQIDNAITKNTRTVVEDDPLSIALSINQQVDNAAAISAAQQAIQNQDSGNLVQSSIEITNALAETRLNEPLGTDQSASAASDAASISGASSGYASTHSSGSDTNTRRLIDGTLLVMKHLSEQDEMTTTTTIKELQDKFNQILETINSASDEGLVNEEQYRLAAKYSVTIYNKLNKTHLTNADLRNMGILRAQRESGSQQGSVPADNIDSKMQQSEVRSEQSSTTRSQESVPIMPIPPMSIISVEDDNSERGVQIYPASASGASGGSEMFSGTGTIGPDGAVITDQSTGGTGTIGTIGAGDLEQKSPYYTGKGAQYHREAITVFFDDPDVPKWDETLNASIEKAKYSSSEALKVMKAIVDKEGADILVLSTKSNGDVQELKEILQLHFSLNRMMARGPRVPMAGISLGSLLDTYASGSVSSVSVSSVSGSSNPLATTSTVTDTNSDYPIAADEMSLVDNTQTSNTGRNIGGPISMNQQSAPVKTDLADAWDNRKFFGGGGSHAHGPSRDLNSLAVKNMAKLKFYQESGPGFTEIQDRRKGIQILKSGKAMDDCGALIKMT